MFTERTSVGLDVHARSIVGAALDVESGRVVVRRLPPTVAGVSGWLAELAGPAAVAYEAGPTGFGLALELTAAGVRCVVAAPSKLQRPAGDRVKTDARDAVHLARLLRMDQVVAVRLPSAGQEAARDLVRAREDVRGDLMRCRHRVSKLLLRNGILWSGGQAWTGAHEDWLRRQRFDLPGRQLAFEVEWQAMLLTRDRRDRLDSAISAMAVESEFTPVVRRLSCLRGVSTLTAFGLAVEIGDWGRFTGSTIGSYLGLVPTESSSGGKRSQGSITKTGNSHARRLLVEAAWHHRRPYRNPTATMTGRWVHASPAARARGHAGNHRLHQRWETFTARKKKTVVANVAVARELAGWCWSLALIDD